MTTPLNETHNPQLRSWVESAQASGCDFPIQNLPFASFKPAGSSEAFRCGVAIGDQILDLAALHRSGQLVGDAAQGAQAGASEQLNALMALGPKVWSALRLALSRGLRVGAAEQAQWQHFLLPQSQAQFNLPAHIGDYTDFYTSIYHATNVGALFRPENPLLPNYKWVPIGYHGRASSIVVSGTPFKRPRGQVKSPEAEAPEVKPSARLDIELELGVFIGQGNEQGEPIDIAKAEEHVFGLALFNDWSARDIQPWEYQPLGPFLAKNFASTLSPWVVTLEALAPYRASFSHPASDPQPLPYLSSTANSEAGALDIQLSFELQTERMRAASEPYTRLAQTNYQYAYWTVAQMVAHHTINGCNLNPGDLLGSGTLSGPKEGQACALIEMTNGAKNPVHLPNGETRTYLLDGDSVILRGWCEKTSAARIGFGICEGTILPAN